jgi:RNA polymerase sigma factor (sigma-70 family)
MVYCVMPRGVAAKIQRSVDRALRDRDGITVVTERRDADRRGHGDRRGAPRSRTLWAERRRIRYADGRRVAERRAALVPVGMPSGVPRAVHQHAAAVAFFEPLDVPADLLEDTDGVRAIVRFQAGELDLGELYRRWFDPIYTYLSVTLDRSADVEAHVATVLAEALRALEEVSPSPAQLRPWLFAIAYDTASAHSSRPARPRGPVNGNGHRAFAAVPGGEDERLDWLSDDDLMLLIDRRPQDERHVLVLRYFAGLSYSEIGEVMAVAPAEAVALHRAAVESLDAMLAAVSHGHGVEERHSMGRLIQQTPVLHRRRRALLAV